MIKVKVWDTKDTCNEPDYEREGFYMENLGIKSVWNNSTRKESREGADELTKELLRRYEVPIEYNFLDDEFRMKEEDFVIWSKFFEDMNEAEVYIIKMEGLTLEEEELYNIAFDTLHPLEIPKRRLDILRCAVDKRGKDEEAVKDLIERLKSPCNSIYNYPHKDLDNEYELVIKNLSEHIGSPALTRFLNEGSLA